MKRLALAFAFVATPAFADLYQFHTTQVYCPAVSLGNSCNAQTNLDWLPPLLDQMTIEFDGTHGFYLHQPPPWDPAIDWVPRFGPLPPNNLVFSYPSELRIFGQYAEINVDVVGTHLAGFLRWNGTMDGFSASGDAGHWEGKRDSDGPGWWNFAGHWSRDKHDVPEPGTLVLLAAALIAVAVAPARTVHTIRANHRAQRPLRRRSRSVPSRCRGRDTEDGTDRCKGPVPPGKWAPPIAADPACTEPTSRASRRQQR